jgi:filamentous hemagglutinin family protein
MKLSHSLVSIVGALAFATWVIGSSHAQVTTSITPTTDSGDLGTVISQSGTTYNITGGTRAGTNLFHSFGNFSVGAADMANFLNTPVNGSLPSTSNILGRVTGDNVSTIFGTIQTTGFGNANLFLMNPAGFVFGPNATLNIGGVVAFTSADYLKLAEGGRFNANTSTMPADILSTAPVSAFGFLGSNPRAITVQGSQFSLAKSPGISLISGDITIESAVLADGTVRPAILSIPSGEANLISVKSSGEVLASTYAPASSMALGTITLGKGSLVDVSGNAGGTVRIRSGTLVMDQAAILANTINADGAPVAIDIEATKNVSITNVDVPALTAKTIGSGNAGEVKISSGNVDVVSRFSEALSFFSTIDTHTSGSGNAGNVTINTGNLTVTGDTLSGASAFIDSGTNGVDPGRGGNVSITAQAIDFQSIWMNTGNVFAFFLDEGGAGTSGNVKITADRINMALSQILTDSTDLLTPIGTSGDITITAQELSLEASGLSTTGNHRSGAVTITSDQFIATGSGIQASTNGGPGGVIRIDGHVIEFKEGSHIASSTIGDGHAGPIIITASDRVSFLQSSPGRRPGGMFNNSFGDNGSLGNAGDITITTPRLEMTGGTRINTTTATSGRGGNVMINSNWLSMSGEHGGFESEPLFNLGTIQSSGLYTRTIGGNCIGPCGNAGNVFINTTTLSMGTGAQINSGTSSSGQGGTIAIDAANSISMSGTLSTGQPGGIQSRSIGINPDAGSGGNISLTAGQSVTIHNGASVSASSTGPGNAGNISIDAGQQFEMQDSSVTTEANLASGGNIDIKAVDLIRVANGQISSSVQGGPSTTGGNITIDPKTVVLQNAQILAKAEQGNGGNIEITTPLFLKDSTSNVDASSRFGLSGTVTVQSPTSNLSGTVGQLASKTNPPQVLLQNRCIALAGGEQSTFILAGRYALPSEPGGWLSSPVAMEHWTGEKPEDHVSRLMVRSRGWNTQPPLVVSKDKSTVLSLRRLTPPGFLVRSFATGTTGCPS